METSGETIPLQQPQVEEKPVFLPTQPQIKCSEATCLRGHKWLPTFALVQCPGCGGQALMQKMENCPICNEPIKHVRLRHDHLPTGSGAHKRCLGEVGQGESMDIEMDRDYWAKIEEELGNEKTGSEEITSK